LVDWCYLGAERFSEPFFDGTIERAQSRPFNGLFTHRTSISEAGEWCAASPGMEPAGFIFHMSRCGSTLVSQMLAALLDTVVISEASPIDWLARAGWIPEPVRGEWLRWVVSALGQKRAGTETRYFIKFDSASTIALQFIRRVFTPVPWVFLYRDPDEVMVSHMREAAAAVTPGVITDCAAIDNPMAEVLTMSREEFAARVIGRWCQSTLSTLSTMDGRGMLVNYTQLPEAVEGAIARHFGMELSPDEKALMRRVTARDAKRPALPFSADGEAKRREASDAMREAAAKWIGPYYAELERMRVRASPESFKLGLR